MSSLKKIFVLAVLVSIIFLVQANFVNAGIDEWDENLDANNKKTDITGIYKTDDTPTAQKIAQWAGRVMRIGPYLGVIFLIYIIIGGYEWMRASGNEEQISKAQKRIFYATLGIIILATLYIIASFFVSKLGGVTGYKILE